MGSECLWKGLFPVHITATLRAIGMPSKTADKWSSNLHELLLDGATTVWRLRCRDCNDGKLPDPEATTRLCDCALELWRNMENIIPVHERKQRSVTENQTGDIPHHSQTTSPSPLAGTRDANTTRTNDCTDVDTESARTKIVSHPSRHRQRKITQKSTCGRHLQR